MMHDLDYTSIPDISALPDDEAPTLQTAKIHSDLALHTAPIHSDLGLHQQEEIKRLEPRPNRMKLKRASSADAPQDITLHARISVGKDFLELIILTVHKRCAKHAETSF